MLYTLLGGSNIMDKAWIISAIIFLFFFLGVSIIFIALIGLLS